MSPYQHVCDQLRAHPRTWLVTGAAGFIGSHLLETLLKLGQKVVGLDNFSTGVPRNLDSVHASVGDEAWERFTCMEGSVADIGICREASHGVDYVLHHAGFISVPLSIEDPVACHDTNVTGTLNMLIAARDHQVQRFVYASSSAVYGDDPNLPAREETIGRPLSPYGASKLMDELYAGLFYDHYALGSVGLRYFNVFGPRQNPFGGYAAVIPQWTARLLRGEACTIHGDGSQTRDFCQVANVVQANILAATVNRQSALGKVYNVALGAQTSLNELHEKIAANVAAVRPGGALPPVVHGPPRPGDIQHSGADISRVREELGFEPEVSLEDGLQQTVEWYAAQRPA